MKKQRELDMENQLTVGHFIGGLKSLHCAIYDGNGDCIGIGETFAAALADACQETGSLPMAQWRYGMVTVNR